MLELEFRRWLVARLVESLAGRGEQAVDATRLATTIPTAHVHSAPEGTVVTPRQSLATGRPGTPGLTTRVDGQPRTLGDGKRLPPPLMPTGAGVVPPPLGMHPLDPPPAPRPPISELYDAVTGSWRTWGDPKTLYDGTYGMDGPIFQEQVYLTDARGTNVTIPFAGQLVNGVRSYYSLAVPWVRNSTAGLPVAGRAYPNFFASFAGVPQPFIGDTIICRANYSPYAPPVGGQYYDPAWLEGTTDIEAVVSTAPEAEPSGAGFTVPVSTVTATATELRTPPDVHTFLYTWFTWYPDGSGDGELRINWLAIVFPEFTPETRRSGEYNRFRPEYPATPEDSSEYQFLLWNELLAAAAQDVHGLVMTAPEPTHGAWGEVTIDVSPHPLLPDWDVFTADRVFDDGVFGRVAVHADIIAERGEPLMRGGNPLPDDVVVGGFIRAWAGTPFAFTAYHVRPVEPPTALSNLRDAHLQALAAAVPVMYQDAALGSIPRPHAVHDGAFCGLDYTASESRFVCCDALRTSDGATLGLVLEGDTDGSDLTLRVSRREPGGSAFTPVWEGDLDLIAPPVNRVGGDASRFGPSPLYPYPHRQWDHPQWPFTVALITVRSVGGGSGEFWVRERQAFEAWTDCPVVLVDGGA